MRVYSSIFLFQLAAQSQGQDIVVEPLSGGADGAEAIIPDRPASVEGEFIDPGVEYITRGTRDIIREEDPPLNLDQCDSPQGPDGFFSRFASDGQGVDIYIVDSGVNGHYEFGDEVKIVDARAFIDAGLTKDIWSHGTAVASLAAGRTAGIARKAKIVNVKVIGGNGKGTVSTLLRGLEYAFKRIRENPSRKAVINMSLGFLGKNTNLENMLKLIHGYGVPIVVSAGNKSSNACNYSPASSEYTIAVGGLWRGKALQFSNYGPCVDIWAPGLVEKVATRAGFRHYSRDGGTSMSAPQVAGVIASYMSEGLSMREARRAVTDMARRLPFLEYPDRGSSKLCLNSLFI